MPPYELISCKICDIPPIEICKECKSGICNHPNCNMIISTYNNKKNTIEEYSVCNDCVTDISSKLYQVEITDDDEIIFITNILLHKSQQK
jgi:hypothetical protein